MAVSSKRPVASRYFTEWRLFTGLFYILLLPASLFGNPGDDSTAVPLLSPWKNADDPHPGRTRLIAGTTLGLYPLSMSWLYTQWYKDYPQSGFRLFNDWSEWEQMDKFAHAWDAYNIAKTLARSFRWAGHSTRRSALYGAGIAFLYQTTIEVFDGFSAEWGFSVPDMVANTTGTLGFLAQEAAWQEQRITLKYSFRLSPYARYRPEVLGSSLPERILKDYNGMTCWMVIHPASFIPAAQSFPRWLSLAIGYGAEGMIGGTENPLEADGQALPQFDRYRQFFLSFDIELSRIRTSSRLLKAVGSVINILHLPAPAIELAPGRGVKGHWLYF
jgi:hypothetical protein